MTPLILANSFKGTLGAGAAGAEISAALKARGFKNIKTFLISDGGDGTLQTFFAYSKLPSLRKMTARDAYGQNSKTVFLSAGDSAVLETALICGLGKIKKQKLRPLEASSYGVGQVIKRAASSGVKHIYVGLGGVACNDGGAGMARALGAKFYDKNSREIEVNTGNLKSIVSADLSALDKYEYIKFTALTDVKNKLLGAKGSARVFGPQKGADAAEVKTIERGLKNLNAVIKKIKKKDFSVLQGSAAAGALGFGLAAFLNARIKDGAEFVFKELGLEKEIKKASFVITSEGKLDAQTFMGKAPGRAVILAQKHKKPVYFVCGKCELTPRQIKNSGITEVLCLTARVSAAAAMREPAKHIRRVISSVRFSSR